MAKKKGQSIDEILNMNKVSHRATIPQGFPPPPTLPNYDAKTEDEYKMYMKQKLLREQWDNSLILYRMKEKSGDKEGMRQVVIRISSQLTSAAAETNYLSETGMEYVGDDSLQTLREEQPSEFDDSQESLNEVSGGAVRTLIVNTTEPLSEPKRAKPDPVTVNETKKTSVSNASDENFTFRERWMSTTLYNRGFAPTQRKYLFIPSQVFLIVMIVISTAVSNVTAGILCGIIGGLLAAGISSWVIWSYKGESLGIIYVVGFYVGEFIAVLLGIVGGFSFNQNFFFMLG